MGVSTTSPTARALPSSCAPAAPRYPAVRSYRRRDKADTKFRLSSSHPSSLPPALRLEVPIHRLAASNPVSLADT